MAELLQCVQSATHASHFVVGLCSSRKELPRSIGVVSQQGRLFERKDVRCFPTEVNLHSPITRRKSYMSSPTFWGVQLAESRKAVLKHSMPPQPILAFSDPELQSVLELASDSELLDLSNILYGRSLLSPLLKSFATGDGSNGTRDGKLPRSQADRDALMVRLEERFLYLAADAKSILSGCRPSYRKILNRVRKKLQVPCAGDLSTVDMESEIFLHLLQHCTRKQEPSQRSQGALMAPSSKGTRKVARRQGHIGLPTILKLRGKEILSTVLKGGGAVTLSTLQRMVFRRLSGKLLVETARYQLAMEAVTKTGQVAALLETRVAMLAARQGLIGATTKYLTVRSAMMVLGPVLWGTLLADMVISAVGTDYARIVRAIYAIAQIRLVRTYSLDEAYRVP